MKKTLIVIAIGVASILGFVYLYLVLAVNTKGNEFKEFKKKVEQDSINYYLKDSGKTY